MAAPGGPKKLQKVMTQPIVLLVVFYGDVNAL